MDVLTPELVLVDPVLAAEARRRLPDPLDCLATRPRSLSHAEASSRLADDSVVARPSRTWSSGGSHATPLGSAWHNSAAGVVQHAAPSAALDQRRTAPVRQTVDQEVRRGRPSLLAIVIVLLVALGIGLPTFDLVPWSSAERPSFAPEGQGGQTTTSAREGKLVLEWPEVDNAVVYDVVVWRGGRRMLDLWPEMNSVDVRAAAAKAGKRLAPGTYQWFVFPAFGSRDDLRFGKTLADGSFTID